MLVCVPLQLNQKLTLPVDWLAAFVGSSRDTLRVFVALPEPLPLVTVAVNVLFDAAHALMLSFWQYAFHMTVPLVERFSEVLKVVGGCDAVTFGIQAPVWFVYNEQFAVPPSERLR